MAWVLDQFHEVQGHIQRSVASSDHVDPPLSKRARIVEPSSQVLPPFLAEEERLLASSSRTTPIVDPRSRKINDNVHEVYKPAGRPSVEMVFYHGLQLVGPDEAHLTTWLSGKGTELWLNWLLKDFQDARILTISYDAHAQETDEQGRMDMYVTCENLVASLLDAQIGQDGCPVVFVGHCIGGLIMKELCVRANSILGLNALDKDHSPVQNLLHNLRGFFSYASPHHGSTLADSSTWFSKGPLFEGITTLNAEAARRNEEFRKLRTKYVWKAAGVAEACPITLGRFKGLVVEEASARQDVDMFYTVAADHFHVCRPDSPESSSFSLLGNFVQDILEEDKALRHGHKVELSAEVVGLNDKVKGILAMHKDTRRLGIVGMGGIGKTTLAKSIYNTISGSYEYTCFLPEVKKSIMADEENPDRLRELIIGSFFHQGRKVHSPFDWDTLKGKTVLIVLDDAESDSQVLGISDSDGFSHKSLVIVTARDRGFLISEKFECHFAEKRGNMDSRTIFCVHAFNQTNAPAGFEEQVDRFTQKCDGLPLALKVAGKYLYKRDRSLWDDAFVKLSRAQSLNGDAKDRLFSMLRVCIDSLAEAEREMFLDVAVCFHDEELAAVKRAWSVCYPADAGWENLVDRGLVATRAYGGIKMHEVLRDLGRRIAYQDRQNIAGHSRLLELSDWQLRCGEFLEVSIPRPWNEDEDEELHDLDRELLFHEGIPKAKVLKMNFAASVMDVNLLGEMDELSILWLDMNGGSMHGELHKLPSTLLYLRVTDVDDWIEVSEETSPSPEDLQLHGTLRQFEIVAPVLEALPRSLGQLSALRHLRIEECISLHTLPESLGSLQALENFHIEGCGDLETLPNRFGRLQALSHLHIQSCPSLLIYPKSFSKLRSLKNLFIDYPFPFNWTLSSSGVEYGFRPSITLTYLSNILEQLDDLKEQCRDLEVLRSTVGQFQDMKVLRINGCLDVNTIAKALELPHLHIVYCDSSETLPYTGNPPDLEELKCGNAKTVPVIIVQLNLKCLEILPGNSLETLSNTLGQLQALEELKIEECVDLKTLPDTLGQLRNLRRLEILRCISLETLPNTLGQLQALEELKIEECDKLTTLPDTIGQLQNLRRLEIFFCNSLEFLPNTLGQLQALEELRIYECDKLNTLPDTFCQLRALEVLEITFCKSLETLPSYSHLIPTLKREQILRVIGL